MEKVDNILKLLLGVLGIAGLLAMLTPSQFAPAPPEPQAATEPPPAAPVAPPPIPEQAATTNTETYNFKIGEPTLDGKPIVDPNSPALTTNDMSSQPNPSGNTELATPEQPGAPAPPAGGEAPAPAP